MSAEAEYLSCAETAKLVRAALKKAFPGQKFSVRSNTYSMGASIDVSWTDGPRSDEVDSVISVFEGAGFDGSIDLKYDVEHWLLPNGEVRIAQVYGTQGSLGYVPSYKTGSEFGEITGAKRVNLGADYVHAHRRLSDEYRAKLESRLTELTGKPFDQWSRYAIVIDGRIEDESGSTLVWRMASAPEGAKIEALA